MVKLQSSKLLLSVRFRPPAFFAQYLSILAQGGFTAFDELWVGGGCRVAQVTGADTLIDKGIQ